MPTSWPQGHTHTALPVTLTTQSGTPIDLTLATAITVKMRPAVPVSSYVALAGTPTVTSATSGQFNYVFAPADVATFGAFKLMVTVTYSTTDEADFFEVDFLITQTR